VAYSLLANDRATYAVDWGIVERLVRSYHRSRARDLYSTVVTTSDSTWYNPFSWSLPDVRSIEVDWARVDASASDAADRDLNRMAERATVDARGMYLDLKGMVEDTSRSTNAFTDRLGALQTENMARITSAVDSYGTQIEVAKFVRDTSADGLMVGATITTGGAGVALLGGGSALKGWAKYEDTDGLTTDRRVGAAVATGVGSFVFGAFKLGGAKLSGGQEAVLTILQAKWDTGVALLEGKSLGTAIATGSLKLAGPFVDRLFKSGAATRLFQKACVPISVTVQRVGAAGVPEIANVAATLSQKWTTKVFGKQVVERSGKAAIKTLAAPNVPPPATLPTSAPARPSLLSRAILTDQTLLALAIVDMERGIGRGL
jgi:hypothetical protein